MSQCTAIHNYICECSSSAPSLPLLPSLEVEESELLEGTCPMALPGQRSDSAAQVFGHQDKGQELISQPGYEMGGFEKTLVIEPTHPSNSGAYYCATADDVAHLIVQNEGDCFVSVLFVSLFLFFQTNSLLVVSLPLVIIRS